MTRLAVIDDALFLEHEAPPEHPERAERLVAVRQGLREGLGLGLGAFGAPAPNAALAGLEASGPNAASAGLEASGPNAASAGLEASGPNAASGELVASGGVVQWIEARDATDDELARVHSPAYVESLGLLAGRSGYLDADTYLSPRSVAAARRAAGAAIGLVEALSGGTTRFGVTLARPPGHHALADRAMGFCLLNNVAVAAAHARSLGHQRVLVLDWDVHHGNGTEAIFYGDPALLFVSLHQFPNYPGTGDISDHGEGEGRGASVNLPLPPGGDDATYAAAFERIVLPIIEQFAPSFALVSCGFDAHARDPLADMRLSAAGYAAMTRSLMSTLPERCPLGLVLEGGYDLEALRESTEAVTRTLLGAEAAPRKPAGLGPGPLAPQHSAALAAISRAQAQFWRLE